MNTLHLSRKEKEITNSQELLTLLRDGGVSVTGESVTPLRAVQVSTVYACVRLLADSVAQLPLKVFMRGSLGEKTPVNTGAISNLFHAPNNWMSPFEFWEYVMYCLNFRGNFYAWIIRDTAGRPVELLPINPDSVVVSLKEWSLTYRVTLGNEQRIGHKGDIFHIRNISSNGYLGLSPIDVQRNSIGTAISIEKHGGRLFRNNARPGGVLTHPGRLSTEAKMNLKESWERNYGGDNAGGTAIFEEGMSYTPVAMTNLDAQFLESRQFQRTEICSIFRVPPHMVGDLTKSSFSNITQQSLEFVKYTILPWVRRIEAAISRDLLTDRMRRQGLQAEFLVDGLERADIETRYKAYNTGVMTGILSPNECRKMENRNPRDGGDEYLTPLNMTTGSNPAQMGGGEPGKKALPHSGGFRYKAKEEADRYFSPELAGLNTRKDTLEKELKKILAGEVVKECAAVKQLTASYIGGGHSSAAYLADLAAMYKALPQPFAAQIYPAMKEHASLVAQSAAKKVQISSASAKVGLTESVTQYTKFMAEDYAESSYNQIKKLFGRGTEKRVDAVLQRLEEWGATRAIKVSANEAVAAVNYYAKRTYERAGVQKLKWVAQGNKSCPFCKQMNGKIVGIRDSFAKRGSSLAGGAGNKPMPIKRHVKHPPIHRGCVCGILPVEGGGWFHPDNEYLEEGKLLKNRDKLYVDPRKIAGYSLDLESENERARAKAEKFKETLGLLKKDSAILEAVVKNGILKYAPIDGEVTGFGRKFVFMLPVKTPKGAKLLETVVSYDNVSPTPRLITCYVAKQKVAKRFPHMLAELEKIDVIAI